MTENPVKQALLRGEVALGTTSMEFFVPSLPQIADTAGADFVLFDMEHAHLEMDRLAMLAAVARGLNIVPLVRVPTVDYQTMSRPFEVGAMGIMVPAVETRDQAQAIVTATKYPPQGQRGTAFGIAHDGYRKGDVTQTMREANEQTLVIAQIETVRGLENIDQIASVDGIDVLWIGHSDLTTSMGIPGQFDHPDYIRAVQRLLHTCQRTGRAAGFRCDSVDHGAELIAQGFRCLAYLNDIVIYREGLASGLAALRNVPIPRSPTS